MKKSRDWPVSKSGTIWINSDNDGVDDNSGEQVLLDVGKFRAIESPTESPTRSKKGKKTGKKKPSKESKKNNHSNKDNEKTL